MRSQYIKGASYEKTVNQIQYECFGEIRKPRSCHVFHEITFNKIYIKDLLKLHLKSLNDAKALEPNKDSRIGILDGTNSGSVLNNSPCIAVTLDI